MPDDHYTCRICGEINCVCSANQKTSRSPVAPVSLGEILARTKVIFKPRSLIRDFNENSVTWKFNTNEEADAFAKAISDLINGIT